MIENKMLRGKRENEYGWYQLAGLIGGPVSVTLLFFAVGSTSSLAWSVAAIGLLMAVWWMTEAVPLATTALLPLVLFPILGISSFETTATSYAHPLIFLFLGGFMLARAMERWGLHKRIAFLILGLGGKEPSSIILSLMLTTAFLSMWISNTAAAMIMLPIGQSIVTTIKDNPGAENKSDLTGFSAALMLGIGYAATIGGMGTLIGTPPNALFAGFMADNYGIRIGFAQWMLIGIPLVVILLPITWYVLTRFSFNSSLPNYERQGLFSAEISNLGQITRGEKFVAILMGLTAAAWIFRPLLNKLVPGLMLSDAGIAMTAAILLFVIPVNLSEGRFLLSWDEAIKLRWDVLILFGGGLALAAAISSSELDDLLGSAFSEFQKFPAFWLILAVTIFIVYLGELASNTAMAAIFLPIAGASAVSLGESPLLMTLPVALAASLGFMLPVATPPNAIIFGSGAVTPQQMLRAGALLDVIGIAIVALFGSTFGLWILNT